MTKHLNNGYKMAYQKVFKLKKLRKQMSAATAMLVYKQTILPYFEYCDFLIDSCCEKELDKMEKLQYRALRIVHKIRNPRDISRVDLLNLSGMKELKPRTEDAKKSPFYRGAKLWLKLPPNIRKMEGKEEFSHKKALWTLERGPLMNQ